MSRNFEKDQIKDIFPLTPMQEGILFHSLSDDNPNTYVVQMVFTLCGRLDVEAFTTSYRFLVKKYDAFRTSIVYEKVQSPLQIVLRERPIHINFIRSSHFGPDNDAFLERFLLEDRSKGFHLTKDPLTRLTILQTDEHDWKVVFSFHHIIMDGWCSDLVINDICHNYISLINHKPITLTGNNSFSEYMGWLDTQNYKEAKLYWENYLTNFEEVTSLPYFKRKENDLEYKLKDYMFNLSPNLTTSLRNLAAKHQVTLNAVFQAIWGILLQKYNNSQDVIFGTVVSGRPSEINNVDKMVGLFINSIPVRVTSDHTYTFSSLITKLHAQSLESQKHEFLPLAEINKLSISHGVFDHLLVLDNNPADKLWQEEMKNNGIDINEVRIIEHTNYNINLNISCSNEVSFKFIFNENVFSTQMIEQISRHLEKIIEDICHDPLILIKDISLTTPAERQYFLSEINNTQSCLTNQTIPDLFEEQAAHNPNHVAITFNEKKKTYLELNEMCNQLGHVLQKRGVEPDELVGLLLDRSIEMIVSIMGVLKSNATYLPMEPEHPIERLTMILEEAAPRYILVHHANLKKLELVLHQINKKDRIECLVVEDLFQEMKSESKLNPDRKISASNLAYVMYTSGSTGKPKGILTQHSNVTRVVKNTNYIDITTHDSLLQLSNYAFDGSTFDIFGALLNGANLVLITKDTILNINQLIQIIQQEITIFFVTTALFNSLIDINVECLTNVRKILFGGERASVEHVAKALKHMGKDRIIHVYGPTENTVFSTYYNVNEINGLMSSIPIGRPITNTDVFILNKDNDLQPLGVIGELCVGGDGLARGYLNNRDLTEEKFIANPFFPTEKMYKTGDLVRWLPNGAIEFLGRTDHQVKIRGFRIELGEIELEILQHQKIKEVYVNLVEEPAGSKKITAYFVAEATISRNELREFLMERLPDYMIPSFFIQMKNLPLNVNGKVEKSALPIPDIEQMDKLYMAPRNHIEKTLVSIWEDVLGIKNISIFDSYFDLGGDSIKAIQISSRLLENEINVNVREIFNNPTVADFASLIQSRNKRKRINENNKFLLTTKQQNIIYDFYVNSIRPWSYVVIQNEDRFDENIVNESWYCLFNSTPVLRTSLQIIDSELFQFLSPLSSEQLTINHEVYMDEQINMKQYIESKMMRTNHDSDIMNTSLISLEIIRTVKNDFLMITISNLLIDEESLHLICDRFSQIYNQIAQGHQVLEQSSEIQPFWMNSSINASNQKIEYLWDYIHQMNPKARSSVPIISSYSLRLDDEIATNLLSAANHAYNTDFNDLLLAALGLAVMDWGGVSESTIIVEKNERALTENNHIGNFTNDYLIDLEFHDSSELSTFIKHVKESYKSTTKLYANWQKGDMNTKKSFSFKYSTKIQAASNSLLFGNRKAYLNYILNPNVTNDILLRVQQNNHGLELQFVYDTKHFTTTQIEKFTDLYMEKLNITIHHCLNRTEKEITPTDLGYSGISLSDFEELQKEIKIKIHE